MGVMLLVKVWAHNVVFFFLINISGKDGDSWIMQMVENFLVEICGLFSGEIIPVSFVKC